MNSEYIPNEIVRSFIDLGNLTKELMDESQLVLEKYRIKKFSILLLTVSIIQQIAVVVFQYVLLKKLVSSKFNIVLTSWYYLNVGFTRFIVLFES